VKLAAVWLILLFGMSVPAQAETPVEIGGSLGMTLIFPSSGGDTQVVLSAPSGALLGLGSFYVTVISGENWMLEPQVLLNYHTNQDDLLFSGMFQLGYLFTPEANSSLYLAGHVGYLHLDSDTDTPAVGAAVGTRKKLLGGAAAVRGEFRYRFYLDEAFDLSEVALQVGLGVVL
jgi:hypothetical protein